MNKNHFTYRKALSPFLIAGFMLLYVFGSFHTHKHNYYYQGEPKFSQVENNNHLNDDCPICNVVLTGNAEVTSPFTLNKTVNTEKVEIPVIKHIISNHISVLQLRGPPTL